MNEMAVWRVRVLTKSDDADDNVAPGTDFAVICTIAGDVKVQFVDGSTGTYPFPVGVTKKPWQIVRVFNTGTDATARYENWIARERLTIGDPSSITNYLVTEVGDPLVTETGDNLVWQ